MKKKSLLLAPLVGFIFTLCIFSMVNRTTAHVPPTGKVQGNIQPQAANAFFTLTVSSAPNPISVGSVLTYTILVTPTQQYGRIIVNSVVPPNTVFCPASATEADGYIFSPPVGNGPFNWTNNSPPPANTVTALSFKVLVNSNAPINSNINLTVRVIGFFCTPVCNAIPESELFQSQSTRVQQIGR